MQKDYLAKYIGLAKEKEQTEQTACQTKCFVQSNKQNNIKNNDIRFLIEKFNSMHLNLDFLPNEFPSLYQREGDRIKRVGSTCSAGISVKENTFVSSHSEDPMGKQAYKPFDVIQHLCCDDDFKATVSYIFDNKERYGLSISDFPKWAKPIEINYIYKDEQENKSQIFNYGHLIVYKGKLPESMNKREFSFGDVLLPKRVVSILSAPCGTGKSIMVASMIGSFVKNSSFLDYSSNYKGGYVVVILTEDDPRQYDYVLKKMQLTEQQRDKVIIIEYFDQKLNELKQFLVTINNIEMIVLDAYLGLKKEKSNNDVESANEGLSPFFEFAKLYNSSCLVVAHSNKNQFTKGLNPDNVMGTNYFVGKSRQLIQLSKPKEDDKNHILCKITKQNLYYDRTVEEKNDIERERYLRFNDDFTYTEEKDKSSIQSKTKEIMQLIEKMSDEELLEYIKMFQATLTDNRQNTLLFFVQYVATTEEINFENLPAVQKSIQRLKTDYDSLYDKVNKLLKLKD